MVVSTGVVLVISEIDISAGAILWIIKEEVSTGEKLENTKIELPSGKVALASFEDVCISPVLGSPEERAFNGRVVEISEV